MLFVMKKALFTKGDRCFLCPKNCIIGEGGTGFCGVRINRGGIIYSLSYGRPCSINIDPIEKKPLYHFCPGKPVLSFGTFGCNFDCLGCQNFDIARAKPVWDDKARTIKPEDIVQTAKNKGIDIIAYTYNEPTVFYEYMLETAKLAKKEGLKNVMVSNGYINEKPLRKLCRYLDAANLDLKFFDNSLYAKYSKGGLEPVLNSLKILKEEGVWIEITTLIVPGFTDDFVMIENMCRWIADNLGSETPLHFSAFYGVYKLIDNPPTTIESLHKAKNIADKYLDFVYVGNVGEEQDTLCKNCGKIIIKRNGYHVENRIINNKCKFCNSNTKDYVKC